MRRLPLSLALAAARLAVAPALHAQIPAAQQPNITVCHSTATPDGKPPEGKVIDRGINSIQAIFDGHQWHIIQILWQAQTPANPVPEKYLP